MASIRDIRNEWRDTLVMASYRDVPFHVELSGRMSGRRTVVHEYPKRNDPYAEDMGRHAVRWSFTAYILLNDKGLYESSHRGRQVVMPYSNLIDHRNALIGALERDDAGYLIHPSLSASYGGGPEGASPGGAMLVMAERYSVSESRERGGYYEFDMQFVEAGFAPKPVRVDTAGNIMTSAKNADQSASLALDSALATLYQRNSTWPIVVR